MTQLFGLGGTDENKGGLLGQQDPLYQNNKATTPNTNANNNNNNDNDLSSNPLAGIFNMRSPDNQQPKPLNFPMASPKQPQLQQQPPVGAFGFPPNFANPAPPLNHANIKLNMNPNMNPNMNMGQNPVLQRNPSQSPLQNSMLE